MQNAPRSWKTVVAIRMAVWPMLQWEMGASSRCSVLCWFADPLPSQAEWKHVLGQQDKVQIWKCCVEFRGRLSIFATSSPLLQMQLNCPQFCLLTHLRLKKYICYEGLCYCCCWFVLCGSIFTMSNPDSLGIKYCFSIDFFQFLKIV